MAPQYTIKEEALSIGTKNVTNSSGPITHAVQLQCGPSPELANDAPTALVGIVRTYESP